jgi:hypothetical protein
MKTLDELDALYAEMAEAERALATAKHAVRAAAGHNPQSWHRQIKAEERHGDAAEAFAASLSAAWPEVRERLRRAEREREAALKAYAALWKLLDEMADEERGIHDLEASWLYTEQPGDVWNALRAAGLAPDRAALTEEPPR